jgi:hypothetical protein
MGGHIELWLNRGFHPLHSQESRIEQAAFQTAPLIQPVVFGKG